MKKIFILYKEVLATLFVFVILIIPSLVIAAPGDVSTLQNPLGGITSFCKLAVAIVNAALIIGIPIAVLFIVWAGFLFVFAQGNPGKLEKARSNFFHVIIGIGIFVGASLIANVIVNTLQQLGAQGINSC